MTTYQSQSTRVRQLFSTLAAATASNPVLLEGELWKEKSATTGRFTGRTKTGDGVVSGTAPNQTISGTAFNDLPFDPTSGGGDPAGTAAAAVAAHVAAADPHLIYTTPAEAAAAAPVQSVSLSAPSGWSTSTSITSGSVTLTLDLPTGFSLPSNASQANWDTAYSERLRWDGSAAGLNASTGRASLLLGTAATTDATAYATPSALATGLASKADLVNGVVPTSQIPIAPVSSINGQTGAVTLGTGDLTESGGNLFFTATRAIAAVSGGGGSSGAYAVGKLFNPFLGTTGNGPGNNANTISLIPFDVKRSGQVGEMRVRVAIALASSQFQLAVYALGTNGEPTGLPILATGGMSGAAATEVNHTLATPGNLIAGVAYALAVNVNTGTTLAFAGLPASNTYPWTVCGPSTTAGTTSSSICFNYTIVQTYGTWPDLTGQSFAVAVGASRVPAAFFKYGAFV